MFVFLLLFISQFGKQYDDFIHSPESDSLFARLARGQEKISDFADNPVVLWFWRSNSESDVADSLLKKVYFRKNFYLSAVLRWEAAEAKNYKAALNKLDLATHLDSTAIENFLSYFALAFKYRNFGRLGTAFGLPIFDDFRNQVILITNLLILLVTAIIACFLTFIAIKTFRYLPAVGHRLDPQNHNKVKGLIPLALLLTPILVLRHFYLIIIFYSILFALVADERETKWLRTMLLILIIFFMLSLPLANFVSFLRTNNKSYQLYEMVNYDTDNSAETTDLSEMELVAYALKQQGKLDQSLLIYQELFNRGWRNASIPNNLANIYFLYDNLGRAETLYNQATVLQDRGEPYFNMGLLKLKQIEYLESSRYMAEAKQRNFSSLLKEPVDIRPDNRLFYDVILFNNLTITGFINRIYALPLILLFILTFLPIGFSPPFYCTTCGRPICAACRKDIENEKLCEDCFTRFKSTRTEAMEESLKIAVTQGKKRINTIITYLINIIIPGAGLIYQDRNLSGIVIVFLVMLGYVPLILPMFFIKPAGWITVSLAPVFFFIAGTIAIVAYLYSFALIRRK